MSHQTHQPPVVDRATSSESATPRGKGRRRFARLAKLATIAAVVASIAGGVLAQPASAARLSSSGTIGYVGLPTGKCTTYPAWKRLDVAVAPPAIYAPDRWAGAGNDSAWVRYEVYVISRSGSLIRASNSSAWALASDNRAAYFPGADTLFTNVPDFSKVWIYVEWYGLGKAAYALDRYELSVSGLSSNGPGDSCWKYIPPGYVG